VVAAARADLTAATGWSQAHDALAAELTVRLAVAAGATELPSREAPSREAGTVTGQGVDPGVPGEQRSGTPAHLATDATLRSITAAVDFAGADAVRFALAAAVPGAPGIDGSTAARRVTGNPAYAVRYAHARAASVLRWAGAVLPDAGEPAAVLPSLPADRGELALLDGLSWLPERVAAAARRGRPDEFARFLGELASRTIGTMRYTSHPNDGTIALAAAARAGLGAGLGLLGISAPERL
jgi:arginyl-tRNA synthetase